MTFILFNFIFSDENIRLVFSCFINCFYGLCYVL